ncbi:MAG TPA: LPS export ABC transporter periplasmic protein LptC [candidate division Zixibacteria bacterium]
MIKKRIFLFLVFSLTFFFCCSQEEEKKSPTLADVPDQVVEKTQMVFTVDGVRSTVIGADYVVKYERKDLTLAKKVHVDFFDKEGKHTSIMDADSGIIKEKRQELEALGNVVVISDNGVKLETESLRWDPRKQKVITDDFVKVTKEGDVIYGYGLEADQKLENFQIKKRVKGTIKKVPEGEL